MSFIIKPIVTEKVTNQADALNLYGFIVKPNANKIELKKEIEKRFNVVVESINTMVYGGKVKVKQTRKGLVINKANRFKKALVTLAEGNSIDIHST